MERSEMSSPTYTSLSHDTERCLKIKTTNLHQTPPLIMHIVVGWHAYTTLILFSFITLFKLSPQKGNCP